MSELQKDVEKELLQLPEAERETQRTQFAIFVVHNKLKEKLGTLPPALPYVFHHTATVFAPAHDAQRVRSRYYAGAEVGDLW